MTSSPAIQYSYALDESGKVIHIDDVPMAYAERGRYYSIDAGDEMIARKGKKVAWHFAHKDGRPGALETYLHQLGKIAFKQAFEESDHFTLTLQTPYPCPQIDNCPIIDEACTPYKDYPFDLKNYYGRCELEKRITVNGHDYVTDICLIPKNHSSDYLVVEIQVTHASTREKLKSGLRIVEIRIEKEDDVMCFLKHNLRERDGIKFYGFHPRLPKGVTTDSVRAYHLKKFQIWKGGPTAISSEYCDTFAAQQGWDMKDAVFYLVALNSSIVQKNDFLFFGIQKALDHGCTLPEMYLPDKFRKMVLPPHSKYYVRLPEMTDGPKLINEQQEGEAVLDKVSKPLGLGKYFSGFSDKEEAYWSQVSDCIYQDNHGADVDAFLGALYLASLRHMYVQLVPPPKWEEGIDDYWVNSCFEYVPVLVETLPDNLFKHPFDGS